MTRTEALLPTIREAATAIRARTVSPMQLTEAQAAEAAAGRGDQRTGRASRQSPCVPARRINGTPTGTHAVTRVHHVMGDGMPRTFSGDALEHALRTARLDVPRERLEIVRDAVESLYAVLDELDPLELGETPPATAFNARWE